MIFKKACFSFYLSYLTTHWIKVSARTNRRIFPIRFHPLWPLRIDGRLFSLCRLLEGCQQTKAAQRKCGYTLNRAEPKLVFFFRCFWKYLLRRVGWMSGCLAVSGHMLLNLFSKQTLALDENCFCEDLLSLPRGVAGLSSVLILASTNPGTSPYDTGVFSTDVSRQWSSLDTDRSMAWVDVRGETAVELSGSLPITTVEWGLESGPSAGPAWVAARPQMKFWKSEYSASVISIRPRSEVNICPWSCVTNPLGVRISSTESEACSLTEDEARAVLQDEERDDIFESEEEIKTKDNEFCLMRHNWTLFAQPFRRKCGKWMQIILIFFGFAL